MNFLFHLSIFLITTYYLLKNIYYGIYEFKTLNNKSGGLFIIFFSIIVVLFANIITFLR